jgi:hypothetical protein
LPFCSRLVPSGARAAFCCCCTWNMLGVVLRRGCAGPVGAHGVSLARSVQLGSLPAGRAQSCSCVGPGHECVCDHGSSVATDEMPGVNGRRGETNRNDSSAASSNG